MKELVSVIIPARDEEDYIGGFSLASIQKQTCKNSETIVVCNSCKDKTAEIARSFSNKIKNLKVLETEKAGVGYARNLGVKHARGNIFVFLDADIAMAPNTVEEIVKLKREHGKVIGICKGYPQEKNWKALGLITLKNILCKPVISNGMIFCDRDFYHRLSGFNEERKRHEDGNFIRRGFRDIIFSRKGKYIYLTNAHVTISMRRFEKQGYRRTILEWVRPAKDYPIVR